MFGLFGPERGEGDKLALAMERWSAGDVRSFEEIYPHLAPRLWSYATFLCPSAPEALFEAAWRKMHETIFPNGGDGICWALSVMRSTAESLGDLESEVRMLVSIGLTLEDAAAILGAPLSTLRSHSKPARRHDVASACEPSPRSLVTKAL